MFNDIRDQLLFIFQSSLFDSLLPTVMFLTVAGFGDEESALLVGLLTSLLIIGYRRKRKQQLQSAWIGFGSLVITSLLTFGAGLTQGLVAQELFVNGLLLGLSCLSLFLDKPLVAYASAVTRGWPMSWYWHARVKPAYRQMTFVWAGFFLNKILIFLWLAGNGSDQTSAWMTLLLGWPALVGLLVLTYIWGKKTLIDLKGPSVKELQNKKKPPWQGQKQGF